MTNLDMTITIWLATQHIRSKQADQGTCVLTNSKLIMRNSIERLRNWLNPDIRFILELLKMVSSRNHNGEYIAPSSTKQAERRQVLRGLLWNTGIVEWKAFLGLLGSAWPQKSLQTPLVMSSTLFCSDVKCFRTILQGHVIVLTCLPIIIRAKYVAWRAPERARRRPESQIDPAALVTNNTVPSCRKCACVLTYSLSLFDKARHLSIRQLFKEFSFQAYWNNSVRLLQQQSR